MNAILQRWNTLSADEAVHEILQCCGSKAWARGVSDRRPFVDEAALLAASDKTWQNLDESDWMEAFQSHPRIGESGAPKAATSQSAAWSSQEQQKVNVADDAVKAALEEGNREYERRFRRIFIVCATGRSADEMLEVLRRRLRNDEKTELHQSAEQQRQITHIRLKKWLQT